MRVLLAVGAAPGQPMMCAGEALKGTAVCELKSLPLCPAPGPHGGECPSWGTV